MWFWLLACKYQVMRQAQSDTFFVASYFHILCIISWMGFTHCVLSIAPFCGPPSGFDLTHVYRREAWWYRQVDDKHSTGTKLSPYTFISWYKFNPHHCVTARHAIRRFSERPAIKIVSAQSARATSGLHKPNFKHRALESGRIRSTPSVGIP